jgi:putative membrane protein
MRQKTKKLQRFLVNWGINTLAVAVAVVILRGHIRYGQTADLVFAAFILGILNAFVRPILMLLALPLLFFTLGLFMLVINALLLYFVGVLMGPRFEVDSFGFAFLGAIIISIVSLFLNAMTGLNSVRIDARHRPHPPKKGGGPGAGPVIDI